MILCHGAAHNDTIITVERKAGPEQIDMLSEVAP